MQRGICDCGEAAHVVTCLLDIARSEEKEPVVVAVCDSQGNLLAFGGLDGTQAQSVQIAINKAYTAARTGRDTAEFHQRLRLFDLTLTSFGDPRYTDLPGGVWTGTFGVGVSGRQPQEDAALAGRARDFAKGGES